jgi:aminopeptidase N
MNKDFYHKVVKGSRIENYLSEKTGLNLRTFFDQYLRDVRIPVFEYYIRDNTLTYRWNNCVDGFDMPLRIYVSGKEVNISPLPVFKTLKLDTEHAVIKTDPGYYVAILDISGSK